MEIRLKRTRRTAALTFLGLAAALLLLSAVFAFRGGFRVDLPRLSVSLGSWKTLRAVGLFAGLGLLLDPRRGDTARSIGAWVERRARLLGIAAFVYGLLLFVAFKVLQHLAFRTGAYDLAMYDHALYNTLHGRFLFAYGLERNFFSEHFSPILLAILPVYAVLPSPLTLLVVEGAAVAGAAWPLAKIARHLGLDGKTAGLVAALYLTDRVLWRGFVFDFHPELFIPLALFTTHLALLRGRVLAFWGGILLTLCIKEELAFVVLGYALVVTVVRREWIRHALGAALLSVAWGCLAWMVVIPGAYPTVRESSHFLVRWSHLGSSYGEVAKALLTRPRYLGGLLLSKPVWDLFLSVGFLPLLAPSFVLAALPVLLLHRSSGYDYEATLGVYYAIPAMVLLMLAVPHGLARLQRRFGPGVVLGLAVIALLLDPGGRWCSAIGDHERRLAGHLRELPAPGTVGAGTTFVPQLDPSRSVRIYAWTDGTDWILHDLRRSPWPLEEAERRGRIGDTLASGRYGVRVWDDGILFLEAGADTSGNGLILEEVEAWPGR